MNNLVTGLIVVSFLIPTSANAECVLSPGDNTRNQWSSFCNGNKDTKTIKKSNIFVDCGNETSRRVNKVVSDQDSSLYAQDAFDASENLPKGRYYLKNSKHPKRTGYFIVR
jgi:hypothetical protein